MIRRETPVTVFVVITLSIVAAVLFGALGTIDHLWERANRQEFLRTYAEVGADQFAASLVLPVWNFDVPQLEKITDAAMQDREVYGVSVTVENASAPGGKMTYGRVRDEQWNVVKMDKELPRDDALPAQRPIVVAGETLGTATVLITPKFMKEDLQTRLIYMTIVFVTFGAVLTGILYLLLWGAVLRPLHAVEQYALEVSSGKEGPLKIGKGPFRGELESLRRSIKKMVELLASRYASLHRNQAMLAGILDAVPQAISWKDVECHYLGCNANFAKVAGLARTEMVVGKTDFDLPWPRDEAERYWKEDHELIREKVLRRHIVEPLQKADGTRIWIDTTALPLLDSEGQIYGILEVFDDITARLAAERLIESQLRFEELLAEVSSLLAGASPSNVAFLQSVAMKTIAEALDSDRVIMGEVDDQTGELVMRSNYRRGGPPFPERLIVSQRYPYLWKTLREGGVWHVPDTAALGEESAVDREHFQEVGIKSQIAVPMICEGEVRFVLVLANVAKAVDVPAEMVPRLRVIADVIANAVLRCEAEEAAHAHLRRIEKLATELTRAEERQRRELAAILHDGVGQNLFAATTQLIAMRNRLNGTEPGIDKVLALVDQVTKDTRELTFELCPPVLYQLGLEPALQRLTEQFCSRYGMACTFKGSGNGPADLNVRGLVYHVVRELLTNVAKHSGAKHVTIELTESDKQVRVELCDDGQGFDPETVPPGKGGFGLFHLRERVELLGGKLKIDSMESKGCRVELVLPLETAQVE